MYFAWEGKPMRKVMTILKYEYQMQMKRIATWGVLLAATIITLLDSFPSASNLARLEFLPQPAYFIYRIMSLDSLMLTFGLMFLLSNRFTMDYKAGVKSLFMAAPLNKVQYISGKISASFLYTFTIVTGFLAFNFAIYALFSPVRASIADYLYPFTKTVFVCVIPVSFFISFCSLALSAILDIRLFYFVSSIVFILNASTVGSAEKMPFYMITSGDLIKLIWQHPKYPFNDVSSIAANFCFLFGCGLLTFVVLIGKQKFWRTEE